MIVLVGESASGKSTIEKELVKMGYKSIVSYTTRPMRNGEINGRDYHFISDLEFKIKKENGFFAETGEYNNWFYGTAKYDCLKESVAVLTPSGLRQLKKIPGLDVMSIYIDVPRRDRLIKILQRGDNVDEAIRRNISDVGQFDGVENEVSYVIRNDGYQYSASEIAGFIRTFDLAKKGEL